MEVRSIGHIGHDEKTHPRLSGRQKSVQAVALPHLHIVLKQEECSLETQKNLHSSLSLAAFFFFYYAVLSPLSETLNKWYDCFVNKFLPQ